jgi:tRNA A37 threonylcarbamoyladenosine dehydratase
MKKLDRVKRLFGDNFEKLQKASVIILGVGGVGGYALDCLYRSGVTNITIVDFDRFDKTNQNRQIGSISGIGKYKTRELKKLYPNIKIVTKKITIDWIINFDFTKYDLILDAIDDIKPKVELIKRYYKKLISTTGSAKRVNSLDIEYISIFKTHTDKFAKKLREELKKNGFKKNFKVIFSKEIPKCKDMGSFVGVTGSFGLTMCSLTIDRLLKNSS